jgi:hypothetical protein
MLSTFMFVTAQQILLGDQIKENEMGWTHGPYGNNRNAYWVFGRKI